MNIEDYFAQVEFYRMLIGHYADVLVVNATSPKEQHVGIEDRIAALEDGQSKLVRKFTEQMDGLRAEFASVKYALAERAVKDVYAGVAAKIAESVQCGVAETKPWPAYGDTVWVVKHDGFAWVEYRRGSVYVPNMLALGLAFKTEAEAEKKYQAMHLEAELREFAGGGGAWLNNERNFTLYFDTVDRKWVPEQFSYMRMGCVYFRNQLRVREAITAFADRLHWLL